MIPKTVSAILVAAFLRSSVFAYDSNQLETAGDPPLISGPARANKLQPTLFAEAKPSSLSLEDLGFEKKDTQSNEAFQKKLDKRTEMLKIHQMMGLATGVAMAFALASADDSVGERGEAGKSARNHHAALGLTTGALYFTTAALAIFAPKIPGQKATGRTKIHKALAFIHFPAMLATMYYGITDKRKLDHGQDPSGHKSTAANIAAVSFFSALAVMVIPFGGDK